jgi:Transglycosylase SLT domain
MLNCPRKPADIVLDSLRDIPVGTPVEEIKRAADAFGLDSSFMEAVAKIESNFDPTQRTGSYIGLFQLSRSEFRKYGSGDITSPRDNAVAAACKLVTEATLFELHTQRELDSSTRMARRSRARQPSRADCLEINVRYRRRPTKGCKVVQARDLGEYASDRQTCLEISKQTHFRCLCKYAAAASRPTLFAIF